MIKKGLAKQHGLSFFYPILSLKKEKHVARRPTVIDHRVMSKGNALPKTPTPDLLLFHWSPSTNRASIEHSGLLTHRKTLQGDWRPPCISFSDDPLLAWHLSGRMWEDIESWDLWMVNCRSQTSFNHYELILDTFTDTGRHYTKEYRIYTRVYKRDLTYLGTRTHNA